MKINKVGKEGVRKLCSMKVEAKVGVTLCVWNILFSGDTMCTVPAVSHSILAQHNIGTQLL